MPIKSLGAMELITSAAQPIFKATGRRLSQHLRGLLTTVFCLLQSPVASAITIDQVRSYEYAVAWGINKPEFYSTLAKANVDMVIVNGGDWSKPLDRQQFDPARKKLIFNYVDVTETAPYAEPALFPNGQKSSIVGNLVSGFTNDYTVQYWNAAWEPELFRLIDQVAAAGYDGVFLDVLDGFTEWAPNNPEGNPPYSTAAASLANLVLDIRSHVNGLHLGRPFYLLGNNPGQLAQQFPNVLDALDAIFNEWVYWGQPLSNGLTSEYKGTAEADYLQGAGGNQFKGRIVFGGDYPLPLGDASKAFPSFALYTSLGWIPSVTKSLQDETVFATGPFLYAATPTNPTVSGSKTFANLISGGTAVQAILTGGDKGDYFIGGPGANTILGGAGDDMIYAHPASSALKNVVDLKFESGSVNATTTAAIQIKINGQLALGPTLITQNYNVPGSSLQDVQFNASNFGAISSMEIDGLNLYYKNSNEFANVFLRALTYNGQTVSLASSALNSGSNLLSDGTILFNNGGVATLSRTLFQGPSPFPSNTSSVIDGGGGVNTVAYRAAASSYVVKAQGDGSLTVTSATTAEGPDTLKNVQFLQFSDQKIAAPVVQSGWWWNPSEGGRGYSMELSSANGSIFFAAYMYDASGAALWCVGTLKTVGSNVYVGSLTRYAGGQSLNGSYKSPSSSSAVADVQLTLTSLTSANLSITGTGLAPTNIAIQRYPIVPNGLNAPPSMTQPQTGWWWNPAEGGRGYFLEVQGGTVFLALYLYDDAGNPVWYAAQTGLTTDASFTGTLVQYANGQTLGGAYKSAAVANPNVGAINLQFSSPTAGTLTLPNGIQIPIQRYSF